MKRLYYGIATYTVALFVAQSVCVAGDYQSPSFSEACAPEFILRQDFNDIDLFDCPVRRVKSDLTMAVGSRLSFMNDQLARTDNAQIDGLTALVLRYEPNNQSNTALSGVAFGPFVQGTGTWEFFPASTPPADTVTGGGFVELGVNDAANAGSDFFRMRAGEVVGSQGVVSESYVWEWLPDYSLGPIAIGYEGVDRYFTYYFVPELMIQYDQYAYGQATKYLLFSTDMSALRIGPEVVFKIKFDHGLPAAWQDFGKMTTFSVTYHASWDTFSGRQYNLFQPILTFNLPGTGDHFAFSMGYGYGNSETTGNKMSQFKMSLAAKY